MIDHHQDLHNLIEDLRGCLHRHPDAVAHYPELATALVKLRDQAEQIYDRIIESQYPPKRDGYVP